MIDLIYIPLNKYDTVVEHFDGSITIPKHEKKRYLFICQNNNNNIFLLNNLTGRLFVFNFFEKSITQICSNHCTSLKNCIGIATFSNKFISYNKQHKKFIIFDEHSIESDISYFEEVDNFIVEYPYLWITDRYKSTICQIKIENHSYQIIKTFKIKGIGHHSLISIDDYIFITDSEENLIRKYSKDGILIFEAITPFIDPIGQVFINNEHYILYGGLVNEVGYENRCWQEQKPFLHKINITVEESNNYITTYTNTFEVEFYYEENLYNNLDENLFPLKVQLALPTQTKHQQIKDIQPMGLKFDVIKHNDQLFAEFTIPNKNTQAIGYRAIIHLKSLKILPKRKELFKLSQKDLLTDIEKEDLDCNNPYFQKFIINNDSCDYDKLLTLRNYVYERLEYKKNIYARNFIEVMEDGYGTCGDYASLMLILLHINNISCQSASGYKIPRFYNATSGIISIYFNHTWLEVYDTSEMVFPIESSSDDKEFNHRFSEGQFLGIDWTHIKLYNGKAHPNLIKILSNPNIHVFDIFKKASVFAIVRREIL